MTSGNFWNLEIGNLESARNWLVLANFNILGNFPTQFRSLSLILNSEFQISNFPFFLIFYGNILEIWKFSGICFFSPISMYGASFPLDFSHWNWFCTQNIKFQTFLDFFLEISWKFSGNLEIFQSLVCLANCNVWGIIST